MTALDCPVRGTAIVTLVDGRPRWEQANDEIHVAAEFVLNPFVTARYAIGEWCPALNAYHARLKRGAS